MCDQVAFWRRKMCADRVLVIVERNAHVVAGHEHSQLAAIRSMVPNARCELLQAKESGEAVNAILCSDRIVRRSPGESLRKDVLAVSNYLRAKCGDDLVIIVPNANAFEIRLALALIDIVERRFLFVLRLLRPEDVGSLEAADLDQVRRATASGCLQFHTETVELKTFLKSRYGIHAEDNFLLQCTLSPNSDLKRITRSFDDPFRVGFLGVPRSEKGRKLMPGILRAIATLASERDRSIQFVMQRAPRSSFRLAPYLYEWRCSREVWRQRNLSINWQNGNLSDQAFRKIMAELDLLLLPYDKRSYANRGSGLIIDGVLAGVPILHTRGLAMANLLKWTGVAAEHPSEFAQHLIRISKLSAPDADRAAKARDYLLQQLERTSALLNDLSQAGSASRKSSL